MRVCVLFCGNNANDPKLKELASRMAEGISSNGHDVDVFDMNLEMGKIISFYEYVVVISSAVSFFSKSVPSNVVSFRQDRICPGLQALYPESAAVVISIKVV